MYGSHHSRRVHFFCHVFYGRVEDGIYQGRYIGSNHDFILLAYIKIVSTLFRVPLEKHYLSHPIDEQTPTRTNPSFTLNSS